jgi:hypothetical protein
MPQEKQRDRKETNTHKRRERKKTKEITTTIRKKQCSIQQPKKNRNKVYV